MSERAEKSNAATTHARARRVASELDSFPGFRLAPNHQHLIQLFSPHLSLTMVSKIHLVVLVHGENFSLLELVCRMGPIRFEADILPPPSLPLFFFPWVKVYGETLLTSNTWELKSSPLTLSPMGSSLIVEKETVIRRKGEEELKSSC